MGELMARGLARSTVTRALATLRSLLAFAVADGRITVNAAAMAKAPTGGQAAREGQMLNLSELAALATACHGPYADLIMLLALEGLRWARSPGCR
jgi:integrase